MFKCLVHSLAQSRSSINVLLHLLWTDLHLNNLFMLLFQLEKAMATHSSTLAWKIPCVEEPGGLQSRQTRPSDFTSLFTFMHWRRKWQRTPVFLPGESQGRGSLVGSRLWGRESQTRLMRLSSSSSSCSSH